MAWSKPVHKEETEELSRFQEDLRCITPFMKEVPALTFVIHLKPEMRDALIEDIFGLAGKAYPAAVRVRCKTAGDICERWNIISDVKKNGKESEKIVHRAFIDWYYDRLTPAEKQAFWRESLESMGVDAFDFVGR